MNRDLWFFTVMQSLSDDDWEVSHSFTNGTCDNDEAARRAGLYALDLNERLLLAWDHGAGPMHTVDIIDPLGRNAWSHCMRLLNQAGDTCVRNGI